MRAQYVVKNEITLGYLMEGSIFMGVLSSIKGGHDPKNGPVAFFSEDIRPATVDDFHKFRVQVPPDFQSDCCQESQDD